MIRYRVASFLNSFALSVGMSYKNCLVLQCKFATENCQGLPMVLGAISCCFFLDVGLGIKLNNLLENELPLFPQRKENNYSSYHVYCAK